MDQEERRGGLGWGEGLFKEGFMRLRVLIGLFIYLVSYLLVVSIIVIVIVVHLVCGRLYHFRKSTFG